MSQTSQPKYLKISFQAYNFIAKRITISLNIAFYLTLIWLGSLGARFEVGGGGGLVTNMLKA